MPKAKHVLLACLHLYDTMPLPREGDTVWCVKCSEYSQYVTVERARQQVYSLECNKCKRVNSRTKVGGEMQARIKAERHARALNGHTVTINDTVTGGILATVTHAQAVPLFPGS